MIGAGHSLRQSGWTMIAVTSAKAARRRPTRPYRAATFLGVMDGLGLLPVKGRLSHPQSYGHAMVMGLGSADTVPSGVRKALSGVT